MMKKTLKLMGLCALAMLALAGCKKDEPNSGKTTVKATISQPNGNAKTGVGAGNMLVWNSGDRIKVYSDDRNEVAEFTTNANNVTEATFSSQAEMDVTDGFYAFYPADDVTYTGGNFVLTLNAQQNGARNTFGPDTYPMYATYASDKFTFHSPCALLAVAMNGTATIGSIVLTGAPDEKLNGTYTFNPSDMANSTLSDTGSNTVTLTFGQSGLQLQSTVNDTAYFALPAGRLANGFTVQFKDLEDNELFSKTAAANPINTTAAETILRMPAVEVNAAPAFDPLNTPLTFEAGTAGVSVEFGNGFGPADLQYSTDGGENWNTYTSAITLVNAGDVVSFRGTNGNLDYNHFSCSGQCYIYGNVISLLDNNYPSATSVGASALVGLFANAPIDIPSDKELLLPAATLAQECYFGMFYGCTSLTTAPALPATTLAQGCYLSMFEGCTNLEMAPALPATTLAEGCYYAMFSECTSLETAPALPATTLAGSCYYAMFYGCTSLETAPALPATTLAGYCYSYMFKGCTSLTTAPILSATTLAGSCYEEMFRGCTSLNSIKCLATNGINENYSTDNWVKDVASSGTFTADPAATWPTGDNGIPSGWTRKNPDGSDWVDPSTTTIDLSTLTGDYEAQNGDILTGNLTDYYKITVADGATVTLRNATITYSTISDTHDYAGITCLGDATLVLEGNNTVKPAFYFWPCIYVAPDKTLTISGDGSLNANNSGSPSAGIGGGYNHPCGNIVIDGGDITASTGSGSAIGGGGYYSACGSITITGGDITAYASGPGAAIGGGYSHSACGNITISSGTINATSNAATGIGAGGDSSCGDITIIGGTITAKGGSGCANIGGCYSGSCGDITITGGTVTTLSGNALIGIGSGSGTTCGDISISGGNVTAVGQHAGIGSGTAGSCGNISISGGDVTSTGQYVGIGYVVVVGSAFGDINISGGTIIANGTDTDYGCGIGISQYGPCGTITIGGTAHVTAIKGSSAINSIGRGGVEASYGTITIGGTVYPDGISTSPYTYPEP